MEVIEGWDKRFDIDASKYTDFVDKLSYFIPVKIENRVLAVLAIGSLTSEKVTYLHHIQTMQPLLNVAAIALDQRPSLP